LLDTVFLLTVTVFFSYFADFEIARQINVLESGSEVVNETRAFIIDTGYSSFEFILCNLIQCCATFFKPWATFKTFL